MLSTLVAPVSVVNIVTSNCNAAMHGAGKWVTTNITNTKFDDAYKEGTKVIKAWDIISDTLHDDIPALGNASVLQQKQPMIN
jgi:hypothetical protein